MHQYNTWALTRVLLPNIALVEGGMRSVWGMAPHSGQELNTVVIIFGKVEYL